MRHLAFVLVLAAATATAGPPPYSHVSFSSFALADDALWAIGSDSCDEAGMKAIAVRLGSHEVIYDAARIAKLSKHAIGSAAWHAGKDIYQPGDKPRVSHDGGKTWTALDGLGAYLTAVAGTAPDDIWGIAISEIVGTSDRGKTWDRIELLVPPRKCF
jgi:hypothetical protein